MIRSVPQSPPRGSPGSGGKESEGEDGGKEGEEPSKNGGGGEEEGEGDREDPTVAEGSESSEVPTRPR